MRQGIIGGIIGLVFGAAVVLSIGAMTDDGRDACAKLADLEAATTIGNDRSMFLTLIDSDEHLLKDCLTD